MTHNEDEARRRQIEARRREEERKALEEERGRRTAERDQLAPEDRLYGKPKRRNAYGAVDGRSKRRTNRHFRIMVRVQPRVWALIEAIEKRDKLTRVVLIELAIEEYLKANGEIPEADLPSDEDLIAQLEDAEDERDER